MVQPLLVSTSAITLAAETVCSILKIDDVVSLEPKLRLEGCALRSTRRCALSCRWMETWMIRRVQYTVRFEIMRTLSHAQNVKFRSELYACLTCLLFFVSLRNCCRHLLWFKFSLIHNASVTLQLNYCLCPMSSVEYVLPESIFLQRRGGLTAPSLTLVRSAD